ncbi:MAG: 2,3-diphosphoglycerate-dependent phosphoglycerate mutase [Actinobacteria bacterium]|nr:2,3-diphosphoglycerate-dependent phosphoglycerate mutase [Actinomycetota bacterium]
MTTTLVLLRHGQSIWNAENRFTGWYDTDLSAVGEAEAAAAGRLLDEAGVAPGILHTSLLTRAIHTAEIALAAAGRSWIPVRRHWRLNERHYGELTGANKSETTARFGADQVKVWRRSYDVPPPPIEPGNPSNPNTDERYANLAPEVVPAAECLADVVDRMLPWFHDAIVPDLGVHGCVLVVAHGNSIRALVKHLDDVSSEAITDVEIPTGVPIVYELGDDQRPVERKPVLQRALGDAAAVAAAAKAVADQAANH